MVFGWIWGWETLDLQVTRRKLGKNNKMQFAETVVALMAEAEVGVSENRDSGKAIDCDSGGNVGFQGGGGNGRRQW